MMAPLPYNCIQCGNDEPQVYKTYASGNLIKLLQCTKCGQLIDKYVEYDPVIVAINLILQNEMAYRHILLNTVFEGFWKLGVIFLFCQAYCFWCFQKGIEYENSSVDFYEIEINFYRVLLRTIISTAIFHGLMLLTAWFSFWYNKKVKPSQFSYITLWKGLCLAGFAEIFELLALIWAYADINSRILFVNGLFLLSNMKSFQVVTSGTKSEAATATVLSFIFQKIVLSVYDACFPVFKFEMEGDISDLLKPISWLVGTWKSEKGEGNFPGITPFFYNEVVEFSICGKQPLLSYSGRSSNPNYGNPMHLENGFLRCRGGKDLSFIVSHNFGLTTIEEGSINGKEIVLKSSNIGRMSNSKEPAVLSVERKFKLDGDKLVQELSMATSKTHDITSHLRACYVKI